ncbi:MAG: anthranilate synthase component I [Thermoleophilia bacterium]|nr:anthranilate synthase component I [Thermoleophilia bacterium]
MTTLRIDVPDRPAPGEVPVTPSLDQVRDLAGTYRQVPVVHTYLDDLGTPVSAILKLRGNGPCFLLESAEEGQRLGRYSMIGIDPQAVVRAEAGRVVMRRSDGSEQDLDPSDPFGAVQSLVDDMAMAPPSEPLAFWGGAVGFFGYDLVRTVEHLPAVPTDDLGIPDMVMMVTGPVVLFDHLRRSTTVIVPCAVGADTDPGPAYAGAIDAIAAIKRTLKGPVPDAVRSDPAAIGPVQSTITREGFHTAVETVRDYIFAGDAFQVVPSQRFSATVGLDPLTVYRGLRTVNPSPYMFYIDCGDVQLVGSSPEMLVKVTDGVVETRPIAGTRPRGADRAEDLKLAAELLADPKERAEHVMLVDLGRNDLGRVCRPGSVRVKDLMVVEYYSHVMHIESSVVGTLAEGRRAVDALRATFPAGTLSGAPKVRAMEIIDELESTKRGPYGGAVGYIGWNGDLDTCITIRTIVCAGGRCHVQAGAGVVADSDPDSEYEETQRKAAGMFRAIEVAAQQEDW